jgi:hypothetical protein
VVAVTEILAMTVEGLRAKTGFENPFGIKVERLPNMHPHPMDIVNWSKSVAIRHQNIMIKLRAMNTMCTSKENLRSRTEMAWG